MLFELPHIVKAAYGGGTAGCVRLGRERQLRVDLVRAAIIS
jgi:hypothetical protein